MNGNEMMITVAGTAVAALIFIFQIIANAIRKGKLNQQVALQQTDSTESSKLMLSNPALLKKNNSAFLLQVFFGLLLVIGFTYWTLHLLQSGTGITWIKILSGSVALISLLMLTFSFTAKTRRNKLIDQLVNGLAEDTQIQSSREAEAIADLAPEPSPEAAINISQPREKVSVKTTPTPQIDISSLGTIPEDSMLRRHFVSHLHFAIAGNKGPRPTDSTLSRHYDAMIAAEVEQYVVENQPENLKAVELPAGKISQITPSKETKVEVVKPKVIKAPQEKHQDRSKIPEDSTLRRHFLTQLKFAIAEEMPPRPTDSTLRRHFDQLLNSKLDNRLM